MIFFLKLRNLLAGNQHVRREVGILYLISFKKFAAKIPNRVACDIEQEIQKQRHHSQYRGGDIKRKVFPDIPGIAPVQSHLTASLQSQIFGGGFVFVDAAFKYFSVF